MAEEHVGKHLQTPVALMNSLEVKGKHLNGGEHYLPFFLDFCNHITLQKGSGLRNRC